MTNPPHDIPTPIAGAAAAAVAIWLTPDHVAYAVTCTGLAFVAALGRDLFWWEPHIIWQRRVGSILASLVAAWMTSLVCWGLLGPEKNIALSIAMAWLGAEGANLIARYTARNLIPLHQVARGGMTHDGNHSHDG